MNISRELVPLHIQELIPYKAGKTIEEVMEVYQPKRISKLASNENRLGFSELALAKARESLSMMMNYPDPRVLELRKAIAAKHDISIDNVICGSGSEGVMSMIIRTFFCDDEEAITADATFIGFRVLAQARGIKVKTVPLTDDYRFDLQAMVKSITSKTKLIYIANPNNPTGTYVTKAEFESFIEQVPDHILVIMDEAYVEFTDGLSDFPDSMHYRLDNVITLRTFSKAYGLAGLRLGYGMAHGDLIHHLLKVKPPFEPSMPAQAAGLGALEDQDFLHSYIDMINEGRQKLYELCDEYHLNYIPSYSNSVVILFDSAEQASQFTFKMLQCGVILRQLPAFGIPEGVRVTIGNIEEMKHFSESLSKMV